ncbi:hypothetical protein ACFWXM_30000, partial [Achromobacter xylosoxidans]|uniref:hypothetical protein n=1 Tax=Alcaligenes xylosoxydans xylosoxydans TaxID=85698 RepID=UPI00376061F4
MDPDPAFPKINSAAFLFNPPNQNGTLANPHLIHNQNNKRNLPNNPNPQNFRPRYKIHIGENQ